MADEVIEVQSDAGTMPVHVTIPHGSGPFPPIVVYMDAGGIREALHAVATRLADAGYLVALPDLYYRLPAEARPDPARLAAGDGEEFGRMMAAARSVDDAAVVADTQAMLTQLAHLYAIDEGAWGCIGFCLGGRLGLVAADRFGEAMRAASLLHPSRIVTDSPDSPHRHLEGVRGELYFGLGAEDRVTPPSVIPSLREELDRYHITYGLDVFPDAEHGYMMPGSPVYNRDAAERAWEKTLELFGRDLPVAE